MSLFVHSWKRLSACPVVADSEGSLHARTPGWVQWLGLRGYCREVEILKSMGYVIIALKRWWIFNDKRVIPFRRVRFA